MSSEGREKARAQPAVTWKRRTAADGLAVYWVTEGSDCEIRRVTTTVGNYGRKENRYDVLRRGVLLGGRMTLPAAKADATAAVLAERAENDPLRRMPCITE